MKNKFVDYLNSLNNVSACNENAYAESNYSNEYYKYVEVKRGIGKHIIKILENEEPCIIILTGHAGDGKTSLLFQVMHELGCIEDNNLKMTDEVTLPSGKQCYYVKDFSEISEKLDKMKDMLSYVENGKFVFLVANTGPLINSFVDVMPEENRDEAHRLIIDLIDANKGKIENILGYKICSINVATVDNTGFVREFINKITNDKLWEDCNMCEKKDNCFIYNNVELIRKNKNQVSDFLSNHYLWQQEHDKKLTIRQIAAHLSFMISGARSCDNIKLNDDKYKYLFSNLLFGYEGYSLSIAASRLKAIEEIKNNKYDIKKTFVDEKLFINNDFKDLTEDIREYFKYEGKKNGYNLDWQKSIKRAYLLMNIETDKEKKELLQKNIFSKWFTRYKELIKGESVIANDEKLIIDALWMLFVGNLSNDKEIPITMKREKGVMQNVQITIATLSKKSIRLKTCDEISLKVDMIDENYKGIYIYIHGKKVDTHISLPLFNYFEDIRKGIISTNIDPKLSRGLDAIKAQILKYALEDIDREDYEISIYSDEEIEFIIDKIDNILTIN
ncbi:MAG: hypothetical protein K6G26_11210 [Lachnospiraceae bacterium]|nr:hypothetical protein [Lachnospiraceae bacterium]